MSATAPPRNGYSVFAWCLLGLGMLLLMLHVTFLSHELAWQHERAEVRHGNELWFSDEEGEKHCVLHLGPPAGERAWQDGDIVYLACYRGKPQFAVLSEDAPTRRSEGLMLWGLFRFWICAPLAFLVARRKRRKLAAALREQPAAPERKIRRSAVDWLAYAAIGLTRGLAYFCAFAVTCGGVMLLGIILYDPDPNGAIISTLLESLFWLLGAVVLGSISRALRRRSRRCCGFTQE